MIEDTDIFGFRGLEAWVDFRSSIVNPLISLPGFHISSRSTYKARLHAADKHHHDRAPDA